MGYALVLRFRNGIHFIGMQRLSMRMRLAIFKLPPLRDQGMTIFSNFSDFKSFAPLSLCLIAS